MVDLLTCQEVIDDITREENTGVRNKVIDG